MNKFKQNISWKPEKKKNSCWNKKGIKAKIPTNQMEKKKWYESIKWDVKYACHVIRLE